MFRGHCFLFRKPNATDQKEQKELDELFSSDALTDESRMNFIHFHRKWYYNGDIIILFSIAIF